MSDQVKLTTGQQFTYERLKDDPAVQQQYIQLVTLKNELVARAEKLVDQKLTFENYGIPKQYNHEYRPSDFFENVPGEKMVEIAQSEDLARAVKETIEDDEDGDLSDAPGVIEFAAACEVSAAIHNMDNSKEAFAQTVIEHAKAILYIDRLQDAIYDIASEKASGKTQTNVLSAAWTSLKTGEGTAARRDNKQNFCNTAISQLENLKNELALNEIRASTAMADSKALSQTLGNEYQTKFSSGRMGQTLNAVEMPGDKVDVTPGRTGPGVRS